MFLFFVSLQNDGVVLNRGKPTSNAGGCQRHFSVKHLTRALKNGVLGSSYNVLSTLQVKKSGRFCGWKTKHRQVAQEDILKLALLGKEELTGAFYGSVTQLNWGNG